MQNKEFTKWTPFCFEFFKTDRIKLISEIGIPWTIDRRIWRKKEKEQSPFFPNAPQFRDLDITMDGGIVKHDKSLFLDLTRHLI